MTRWDEIGSGAQTDGRAGLVTVKVKARVDVFNGLVLLLEVCVRAYRDGV